MTIRNNSGFTLIEAMIVVAVGAILAVIAATSYSEHTERARRTDAKSTLTETASTLEKCRALYGVYNSGNCSISNGATIASPKQYYSINVVSGATTFELTATAQGVQAGDTDCLEFTLNELGQQSGTSVDCW